MVDFDKYVSLNSCRVNNTAWTKQRRLTTEGTESSEKKTRHETIQKKVRVLKRIPIRFYLVSTFICKNLRPIELSILAFTNSVAYVAGLPPVQYLLLPPVLLCPVFQGLDAITKAATRVNNIQSLPISMSEAQVYPPYGFLSSV